MTAAIPEVSVVMAVFNGQDQLSITVDSILGQQNCDFEFIIVDDGSTDNTPGILARYARQDNRITVLSQPNQGLTKALIHGCNHATGDCIARQDCGDRSLPGRLFAQHQFLDAQASGARLWRNQVLQPALG